MPNKSAVIMTLFFIFLSTNSFAGRFSSNECLRSSFEASIKHDGKFFGLIKNKLTIKKEECLITLSFDNILETRWKIDLCRKPIHMKMHSKGSESVYKRNNGCRKNDVSKDFCIYKKELEDTLQDYGLIYAQGERESLKSDHGKTFCSYLLIKHYLDEGVLFSKYSESINLFDEKKTSRNTGPQLKADVLKKSVLVTPKADTKPSQKENTKLDEDRF